MTRVKGLLTGTVVFSSLKPGECHHNSQMLTQSQGYVVNVRPPLNLSCFLCTETPCWSQWTLWPVGPGSCLLLPETGAPPVSHQGQPMPKQGAGRPLQSGNSRELSSFWGRGARLREHSFSLARLSQTPHKRKLPSGLHRFTKEAKMWGKSEELLPSREKHNR